MKERLQKILARWGVASRRACERLILSGRVRVNGVQIWELGFKADPEVDEIRVDEHRLSRIPPGRLVIALNKPAGYLCTCRSESVGRRTVVDLIPKGRRLFPVGRLDKESSGLLLLTNDGEFAHRIMHPRFGYDKEYLVRVRQELGTSQLKRIYQGISLDGHRMKPLDVRQRSASSIVITLGEGRKREVRHMMQAVGAQVLELCRIRIGPLRLGKLPSGQWRELSEKEIEKLLHYRQRAS
ncbi:MAG: rRNA pseudouridine synthase [Calditrichaeota bacterium]|nr:rRNA pseudouridine synthase [Calditrichota bacterium]